MMKKHILLLTLATGLTVAVATGCSNGGDSESAAPGNDATATAAAADPAAKPYPLKTCLVSDEELGSMGDPYVFVHEGQEIKLCCKSCLKDFQQDPQKYLPKLK